MSEAAEFSDEAGAVFEENEAVAFTGGANPMMRAWRSARYKHATLAQSARLNARTIPC
jgi:hypothetical protein